MKLPCLTMVWVSLSSVYYTTSVYNDKLTASELSSDLCSRFVAPEIWARAAASASTAPLSSISFSADALKYPIAATGTESRNLLTVNKSADS